MADQEPRPSRSASRPADRNEGDLRKWIPLPRIQGMDTKKQLAKLVKDIELPIPEGHVRMRKGFYHRFVPASQIGEVGHRLSKEWGKPTVCTHGCFPTLWWFRDDARVGIELPHGDNFAVISVGRAI